MGDAPCQGPAQRVMCLCNLTGIEPTGNMVKQPAKFTVDTISAGQGDLMVFVEDPEGNKEEVCWKMLPLHGTFVAVTGPGTVPPFSKRILWLRAVRVIAPGLCLESNSN